MKEYKVQYGSLQIEVDRYDDINLVMDKIDELSDIKDDNCIFLKIPQNLFSKYIIFADQGYMKHGGYINGYYFLYRWIEGKIKDPIQPFYTTKESVTVVLYNTLLDKYLIIYEKQNWKLITGTMDNNENIIQTAIREIGEEVGIYLDKNISPLFISQERLPNLWNGMIQDLNTCMLIQTDKTQFKVDGKEVDDAMWISIQDIINNKSQIRSDHYAIFEDIYHGNIRYKEIDYKGSII